MGPPDMSNVDPGLQPTLIALLYLFPGLALAVLIVRFWKRHRDHNLGGGEYFSYLADFELKCFADDVVIALAWMLALANSIITHFCKTNESSARVMNNNSHSCEGDVYRLPCEGRTVLRD